MAYCTSCPETAARIRDITYPHNKLYWATVIFLTVLEMLLVLINCILYAEQTQEKGKLITLSIFQLLLDAASIVIAAGIWKNLHVIKLGRRKSSENVPHPQSCVFHFITSFPSEWVRFYCCVLIMASFEEENYSIAILIQCFMGPVMSFYTLRQMIFNALIWVNKNDCQYVINTLFTHLAITANLLWVLIMLAIGTISREWTDENTQSAAQLALVSASGQLGTLFMILTQGYCCRGKKSKAQINVLPRAQKVNHKMKKRLNSNPKKSNNERLERIKRFVPQSMMNMSDLEQSLKMGLDPLNESALIKEINLALQNHPNEWVNIKEIVMHLKIKIHFIDWSEYGFIDHKQFLIKNKNIYQMKFQDNNKNELLLKLRDQKTDKVR